MKQNIVINVMSCDWQFTTEDAQKKLKKMYPIIE